MLKELPLAKVYQFIEPGPVALVTTQAPGEKPNVMTMSWHMMLDFEPPLIGCVVAEGNYSFAALRKTRECVIAVPPASLAKIVTDIGNCTGGDTDKFASLRPNPPARQTCRRALDWRSHRQSRMPGQKHHAREKL